VGIATVRNADGRTAAKAPIVAFWTSTFFVGDDKQTARTRSNEDEALRIGAVVWPYALSSRRYNLANSGT
jgi:hypothetical protein